MKFSLLILACVMIVMSASPASGQVDNSCVYNYDWPKYGFGFCLTKYGTLASLHGGQNARNQLNLANPIEGWAMCDTGGFDIFSPFYNIPGLGMGVEAIVSQPKGAGKLPILFSWYYSETVVETVSAVPSEGRVIFTMTTPKKWGEDSYQIAYGPILRMAQVEADGLTSSSFQNSGSAAFGFQAKGTAMILTAKGISGRYAGVYGIAGVTSNFALRDCSLQPMPPFVGSGAVFNSAHYDSFAKSNSVFEYKVF